MPKHAYALDQLSALELDPLTFVDVAAGAGYQAIGFHLDALPLPHASPYSMIADAGLRAAFARRLRDSGLSLHVIEPFLVMPDVMRGFDSDGYQFDPGESDADRWRFTRS